MKKKCWIYAAAFLVLLAAVTSVSADKAFASSGSGLDDPSGTPPPPQEQPVPGTPDPSKNGGNDGGGGKKTIIQTIRKIFFDYETMGEAIVNTLKDIFSDAAKEVRGNRSPLYEAGEKITEIVFQTNQLKVVRKDAWKELRKVAFALLPLVAALTIWASMKDGLYSVTGYANTLEAVSEFIVSVAFALSSYWLMEQAISLTKTFSLAISYAFPVSMDSNILQGALIKIAGFNLIASMHPLMAILFYVFVFVFMVAYMGSVVIAFLAREVVLVITVAMAPIMIILGSIRPLSWLRALWAKAFLIVLLILPVNVLVMGVASQLLESTMDPNIRLPGVILQLLILAGTISILIAVNTTLGKMVYGAAMEVAQKVGSAVKDIAAIGAGVAGAAVGVGGLAALGGAAGGTEAAAALGGGGGGGSGGGSLSGAVSSGADVTRTGQLSSIIGTALGGSSNKIVSSFGKGMSKGGDIKRQNAAINSRISSLSNQSSLPGSDEGFQDAIQQFDTDQKAAYYGEDSATLTERAELGKQTSEASMAAVEGAGFSAEDMMGFMGHSSDLGGFQQQTQSFIRSQSSTLAIGNHPYNKFKGAEINFQSPPGNIDPQILDHAAGHQIVMNEHRNRFRNNGNNLPVTPELMSRTADAVHNMREQGNQSYGDIINEANNTGLRSWLGNNSGIL